MKRFSILLFMSLTVVFLLLSSSCALRGEKNSSLLDSETRKLIATDYKSWSVMEDFTRKKGDLVIISLTDEAEAEAVRAVCNTSKYICLGPSYFGQIGILTRVEKEKKEEKAEEKRK